MTSTPNLGLPLLEPNQSQPHVPINEAFEIIDALELGSSIAVVGEHGSPTSIVAGVTTLVFNGAEVTQPAAGIAQVTLPGSQVIIQLALSDLTSALAAGNNKAYFRSPYAMTITAVRASLLTASSSGSVIVDINKNGSTILSTKLSIDANEKTSTTAASAAVISDASVADDDEIALDVDDDGTNAAGLIVLIYATRVS